MSKDKLHLIMPMGGAGSRFFNNGYLTPKPLIDINGKPFLYWATRSIQKYIDLADITFVVLNQHIDEFEIDKTILKYFPGAHIINVDFEEVKAGPALTCLAGVREITDSQPILFNDCDHMFKCKSLIEDANAGNWDFDGGLLTFESTLPQYSYIKYNQEKITGTVEKEVVSNSAICGAYIFRNKQLFSTMAEEYFHVCNYKEYFVSGIYNVMCQSGLIIKNYKTDFHVPFGTPEEYQIAQTSSYFEELL